MEHHFFAGRFQPFHNGHLEMIKGILTEIRSPLIVLIVRKAVSTLPNNLGSENLTAEKNPFTTEALLKAMLNVAASGGYNFLPVPIPQPSSTSGYEMVQSLFPDRRIWHVPDTGDSWDDQKADYYRSQGDAVVRHDSAREASGTEIRELIARSDFALLKQKVPAQIFSELIKKSVPDAR